jgi:hypothetical protein
MQKPNTKTHWTALAVAQYYDEFDEPARARDLYPFVQDIHDKPESLVAALQNLRAKDEIGYILTNSPAETGSTMTYAHYPTEETITTLMEIDTPTQLPNGQAIPDSVEVTIPPNWPDDPDELTITTDSEPLTYRDFGGDYPRDGTRRYSQADLRSARTLDLTADGTAADDEEGEQGGHDDEQTIDYSLPTEDEESDSDDSDTSQSTADIHPQDTLPSPLESSSMDTPTPGEVAGEIDWSRIATRLERKATEADENGLTEIASAYSQFATLAAEGRLDDSTAYMLLGTPVLRFEAVGIDPMQS